MIASFFTKHKIDIFYIILIVLISSSIRILQIDKIPGNITGDEITNITNIYEIIFNKNQQLFNFMGDGSVAGIIFYLPALYMKLFGINNSILVIRVFISILSILSLIPFYFILKSKTSKFIAFIFTILLSSNYTFLNFSRTAWVNMTTILSGLLLILFLEKAEKENKYSWYITTGFFAGISLYGYHYGRILTTTTILYLFFRLVYKKHQNLVYLKSISIFMITILAVFLPFFVQIVLNKAEDILRRPKSTYAFSDEKILSSSVTFESVLWHQFGYTTRGFIFLDPSITNEGIENSRYVPQNKAPVNFLIKIIFTIGLIYYIFNCRKYLIWLFVFLSVLVTQLLTNLPPNFSRGLFYIPFIYLVIGIFIYYLWIYLKSIFTNVTLNLFILVVFVLFSIFTMYFDISYYFKWMKKEELLNARKPAIIYSEFPAWQAYQIKKIKNNENPITVYDWEQINSKSP